MQLQRAVRAFVLASLVVALAPGCAANVCVVHERVRGTDMPLGLETVHRFAADGRPLTIETHNSLSRGHSRYRYDPPAPPRDSTEPWWDEADVWRVLPFETNPRGTRARAR